MQSGSLPADFNLLFLLSPHLFVDSFRDSSSLPFHPKLLISYATMQYTTPRLPVSVQVRLFSAQSKSNSQSLYPHIFHSIQLISILFSLYIHSSVLNTSFWFTTRFTFMQSLLILFFFVSLLWEINIISLKDDSYSWKRSASLET